MTLTTAVAPVTVEGHLPQVHPCADEMPFTAVQLNVELGDLARGFYPFGTSRWESGLFVAAVVELSRNAQGSWVGFELTNVEHRLTVARLVEQCKLRHAPKRENDSINVHAIVEAAASDLGRTGLTETKTVLIPGDEESDGTSVIVIFPTANLVKELDNHYGHKG